MTWDEWIQRISRVLAEALDAQELHALLPVGEPDPGEAWASKAGRQAWLYKFLAGFMPDGVMELLERALRARPGAVNLIIIRRELEDWIEQQGETYRGLPLGAGGLSMLEAIRKALRREQAESLPPNAAGPAAAAPDEPTHVTRGEGGGSKGWTPPPAAAAPEEPKHAIPPDRTGAPSPTSDVTTLRLDARAPERVLVGRAFTIAAAVRQLTSPELSEPDLPVVKSGDVPVEWPQDQPFVRLRIQVHSAQCTINGEPACSFRLYRGQDSPICYFDLTPTVSGQINVRVELYQEDDLIGSARINTTAEQTEQLVGKVNLMVSSVRAQPNLKELKWLLVGALLKCPSIKNPNRRNAVVDNLRDDIRENVERDDSARADVYNIVTTALSYEGGLQELVESVRNFDVDTAEMAEVDHVMAELAQVV